MVCPPMICTDMMNKNQVFLYYSLSNSNLLYSANKKNTGPGRLLLFTFLAQGESESEVQGLGTFDIMTSFLFATMDSDLVLIMSGHLEKNYNCMYRSHGYYP